MTQSRFKSPVFWGALAAQVISLGQLMGVFAKYGIDIGMVGDVVAGLLQIAVLIGILNNPTDKVNF